MSLNIAQIEKLLIERTSIQLVQPYAFSRQTSTILIDTVTPTSILSLLVFTNLLKDYNIQANIITQETAGTDTDVEYRLYKDGIELDITDRFIDTCEAASDFMLSTPQYMDVAPTGFPTLYEIRALASNVTTFATINRLIKVESRPKV